MTGLIRTSGPTISLNGAWAQNIGESAMFVEFLVDKAGIKLQYGGDFKVFSSRNGSLLETSHSFLTGDMFYDQFDGFLQSIRTQTKNKANIDQVMIISEVIDALYQSAAFGREIVL